MIPPMTGMDACGAQSADRGCERSVLRRLRREDSPAFRMICVLFRSELVDYCARVLQSHSDVEDAVQLVLFSAYRALTYNATQLLRLRPRPCRTTKNQCISMLRCRSLTRDGPTSSTPTRHGPTTSEHRGTRSKERRHRVTCASPEHSVQPTVEELRRTVQYRLVGALYELDQALLETAQHRLGARLELKLQRTLLQVDGALRELSKPQG